MTMPFFMPIFKNIFRKGVHLAVGVRFNPLFLSTTFSIDHFGKLSYTFLSPELNHSTCSDIFLEQSRALSLHNLTIFVTQEKRVDFSEVTGVRALFFRNVSVGEIPPEAGRGAKLPHR
jgi:hypothetical protein